MILALVVILCLTVGCLIGFVGAALNADRLLAAMSTDELKAFGERVAARRKAKTAARS